jgi:hypothetical protein
MKLKWGKQEVDDSELPEALRGKTPEQIAEALRKASALEAKVTELEGKNADVAGKFESFGQTLNTLNEKIERLATPPSHGNDGNSDGNGTREPASFLVDPDRAFAERAAPLVGLALQTAAVTARNAALEAARGRQRTLKGNLDGLIFEKFGTEIDELSKGVAANQLANPATWEHLFFNVKGRHADEIVSQNREGKGDFFVEPTKVAAGSPGDSGDKLTPLEEKIAKRMGVTPEAYLKQRKAGSELPSGIAG